MLIVCPACASAYEIDAEKFGGEGRSVRCAACRETWFVAPEAAADESAEPAFAEVEAPEQEAVAPAVLDHPTPLPRRPRPAAKPRGKKRKPLAARVPQRMTPALAAGLAVLALLPLAALGRGLVVRVVPQSAALFSAIGLPVNLRGVEIRDVAAFRNPPEAGRPAELVVEGDLHGVARGRVAVPLLEVEIRDGQDRTLRRWTFAPPRAALERDETARFRASLAAPPAEARGIEVRFADAEAPAEPARETGHEAAAAPAVSSAAPPAAPPAAPTGHGGH